MRKPCLLEHLDPARFVQVPPAWLVQLAYVRRIDLVAGLIFLQEGTVVPLATACKAALYRRLLILE